MSRARGGHEPGRGGDGSLVSVGGGSNRGQLVLVAAVTIAIALVLVLAAYVQLGYAGDAGGDLRAPDEDALAAVETATVAAADERQGDRPWEERTLLAGEVADALDERFDRIETARIERAIAYRIERNHTVAAARAESACPGGPGREFGSCETVDGVIIQERAGETHVVAVAVDLRVVTAKGTFEGTYVIDAETGESAPRPTTASSRPP